MFTTIKRFNGFPCSHRQHTHDGHCKFVHGYSRWFEFEFWSPEADTETLFIVDFGKLKWLKAQLDEWFDHTLLINADDPALDTFLNMHGTGLARLTVLPNVGMEAVAIYLWSFVEARLRAEGSQVRLIRCTVGENEKNSGQWIVPMFADAYSSHYSWLYKREIISETQMMHMRTSQLLVQGIDIRKYLHPEWINIVFKTGVN